MRRIIILMTVVLLSFLQSSCTNPKNLGSTAGLHKGQTRAEVRKMYGRPQMWEMGPEGRKLDLFMIVGPKITTQSQTRVRYFEVRSVHVLYDRDDKVESFSHSFGELKAYAKGHKEWQTMPILSDELVTQIERNVTTRADLMKLFGPVTTEGMTVYGSPRMIWHFMTGREWIVLTGRELYVILNPDGTVRDFSFRDGRQ